MRSYRCPQRPWKSFSPGTSVYRFQWTEHLEEPLSGTSYLLGCQQYRLWWLHGGTWPPDCPWPVVCLGGAAKLNMGCEFCAYNHLLAHWLMKESAVLQTTRML